MALWVRHVITTFSLGLLFLINIYDISIYFRLHYFIDLSGIFPLRNFALFPIILILKSALLPGQIACTVRLQKACAPAFITIKDVILLLDIFSEITLRFAPFFNLKNSCTFNYGRSYIAGGCQTKDQILARAGRRCRGEIREITEGVVGGEGSQGTSKHFFLYRASSLTRVHIKRKRSSSSIYASSSCTISLYYVSSVHEAAEVDVRWNSRVSLHTPQTVPYTVTRSGTTKYPTEVW